MDTLLWASPPYAYSKPSTLSSDSFLANLALALARAIQRMYNEHSFPTRHFEDLISLLSTWLLESNWHHIAPRRLWLVHHSSVANRPSSLMPFMTCLRRLILPQLSCTALSLVDCSIRVGLWSSPSACPPEAKRMLALNWTNLNDDIRI